MKNIENTCTIDQLKAFLDTHNFESALKDETDYEGNAYRYLDIQFPVARSTERIVVREEDNLDAIIDCGFVKYRGIADYEAIWSKELKCIECEIQDARFGGPGRLLVKTLSSFFEVTQESTDEFGRTEPSECAIFSNDTLAVTNGYCSKEFAFLSAYKEGRHVDISQSNMRFRITLKISNIAIDTEESARLLLEKISNALFFQTNILYNFTITLAPRRIPRIERIIRRRRLQNHNVETRDLKLDYEYEKIPMSLYWFAQNNIDSPIFAFFAFYQVLEYYFPIYSQIEAKNKIKNLFKDPRFSLESDADMMRLLNTITSKNLDGIGDEREQLNNVLRNIVTGDEVMEYINSREFLTEYYNNKISNKLSGEKLPLNDVTGIVSKLSARIYDIRCRIVHNKASETHKKILPVTKEEEYLRNEVYILKFLAEKAIITNSKTFQLK